MSLLNVRSQRFHEFRFSIVKIVVSVANVTRLYDCLCWYFCNGPKLSDIVKIVQISQYCSQCLKCHKALWLSLLIFLYWSKIVKKSPNKLKLAKIGKLVIKCQNFHNRQKLSKTVKIVKNCKNCQQSSKLSKLSELSNIVNNCQNTGSKVTFFLERKVIPLPQNRFNDYSSQIFPFGMNCFYSTTEQTESWWHLT